MTKFRTTVSRRGFMLGALAAGAAAKEATATRFSFVPFEVDLPIPPVLQPHPLTTAPGDVYHGIAPEFDALHPAHDPDWNDAALKTYELHIEQRIAEIIPGVETPVFTYRDANAVLGGGSVPGPTILARFNEPIVVRQHNDLIAGKTFVQRDIEVSTHLHGGHSPAHSDGFPNFYILPGRTRDYYYPNTVAKRRIGADRVFDPSAIPSTLWYHDHAMDITGYNVCHGLASFYLMVDAIEQKLMDDNVLPDVWKLETDPEGATDIPLVIVDQAFNRDGTLYYDFLDHNGRIGDVFTVNGVAQPRLKVRRRKYRLRILNGSNARVYQLRLSTRDPMRVIGTDSWLLPGPISVRSFRLAMAERHDVIIDFSRYAAGTEIFLENVMHQPDGRGPKRVDPDKERTQLVKFIVEGGAVTNDVSVDIGTGLRPFDPIREQDVVATRRIEVSRRNGAWQINHRFFNPRRADAVPEIDPDGVKAERWIFKNNSAGWWHPMHIHLEHHEIQRINGRRPPPLRRFRSDMMTLAGDDEVEILVRFRTFTGPFVFHYHNLEHEDMRMMAVFDPRNPGETSPLDGKTAIEATVSGIPDECEDLESDLFATAESDVERVEDEGVGIPCDDFDLAGAVRRRFKRFHG